MNIDPRRNIFDWSFCLLVGFVFCIATMHDLRLPGPFYDEIFPAAPAVNFYENRFETSPMQIDPSTIRIFGRQMPLMLLTYVGSLKSFLYLPVFYLFGDDLTVVRIMPIAIGVLGLWISYFFFRNLFGRPVAIISLVLLLSDPGFIFFMSRDIGPPALAFLLRMSGLYFFLQWWRSGRRFHFLTAAFIWGLALYNKADFLWVMAASAFCAVAFFRDLRQRLTLKTFLSGCTAFCLGAAPFIALNVLTKGATFAPLFQPLPANAEHASLLANLWFRCRQIVSMWNGNETFQFFMRRPAELSTLQAVTMPLVMTILILLSPLLSFFGSGRWTRRKMLFPFVMGIVIFLQTAKSALGSFGGWHVMNAFPFLHAAAAVSLASLASSAFPSSPASIVNHYLGSPMRIIASSAIAGILLLVVAAGFTTIQQTHASIQETGGCGAWSDAIYDLDTFLEAQHKPIAAVDWGFSDNLLVLSKGRLKITRVYKEFFHKPMTVDLIKPSIAEGVLYLCHPAWLESFTGSCELFKSAAAEMGYTVMMERQFYQRDGAEVYEVYSVHRRLPN